MITDWEQRAKAAERQLNEITKASLCDPVWSTVKHWKPRALDAEARLAATKVELAVVTVGLENWIKIWRERAEAAKDELDSLKALAVEIVSIWDERTGAGEIVIGLRQAIKELRTAAAQDSKSETLGIRVGYSPEVSPLAPAAATRHP